MALRKFPYGYQMKDGILEICEPEAGIIRNIFQNRAEGKSNYAMAKELYDAQTEYFSDSIKKASCKISSILYDERYVGAENYPAIIDEDLFQKVQNLKGEQYCKPTRTKAVSKSSETLTELIPELTTYIPNTAIFEKEAALKKMLKENIEDTESIRQFILDLASEKYNCII